MVSLLFGGKSHVSNGQNVSLRSPANVPSLLPCFQQLEVRLTSAQRSQQLTMCVVQLSEARPYMSRSFEAPSSYNVIHAKSEGMLVTFELDMYFKLYAGWTFTVCL